MFLTSLITFMCDVRIDLIMCEPHYFKDTSRHMLGLILAIFEIYQLMITPGLFDYHQIG